MSQIMFAPKLVKVSLVAMAVLSASFTQPVLCGEHKSTKRSAAKPSSPQNQSDEAAVKAKLAALKNCVLNGDAKTMAKLWTEDGHYIDDEGNEYIGREALEKNLSSIFQENGKAQVEIVPESIRMPSSSVALVDGTVKRKEGSANPIPVSRYSLVLVKQNGEWLISEATETPVLSQENSNPLQELDWLIGDWLTERDGASVKMTAEWAPSKNFIYCKYEIKKPNGPQQVESQVIGWDPRTQNLLSWHFDSNGGFGHGTWIRRNNQWMVDATAVERDGSVSTSTNVLSIGDPNSFSYQSVNRHVDGVFVGDAVALKVQRILK